MKLNITGPNIGLGGEFHVHAAGCADLRKAIYRGNPESCNEDYDTFQSMVEDYYCHQIDESGGTWDEYAMDFHVFPCVTQLAKDLNLTGWTS